MKIVWNSTVQLRLNETIGFVFAFQRLDSLRYENSREHEIAVISIGASGALFRDHTLDTWKLWWIPHHYRNECECEPKAKRFTGNWKPKETKRFQIQLVSRMNHNRRHRSVHDIASCHCCLLKTHLQLNEWIHSTEEQKTYFNRADCFALAIISHFIWQIGRRIMKSSGNVIHFCSTRSINCNCNVFADKRFARLDLTRVDWDPLQTTT